MSHYMIVVPEGKAFQVGLADGIHPWKLHATCLSARQADRICTLLAMHYRVPAYPMTRLARLRAMLTGSKPQP